LESAADYCKTDIWTLWYLYLKIYKLSFSISKLYPQIIIRIVTLFASMLRCLGIHLIIQSWFRQNRMTDVEAPDQTPAISRTPGFHWCAAIRCTLIRIWDRSGSQGAVLSSVETAPANQSVKCSESDNVAFTLETIAVGKLLVGVIVLCARRNKII